MKAQLIIKADKELKREAQKVARQLGLPLSTVINGYLRQFIRTKEVHFSVEGELRPAAKRRLDRLHRDVVEGKNLSPMFNSVQEAIRYLRSR